MIFYIMCIIVLWTWRLTPLWVNIVGSILFGFGIVIKITKEIIEIKKVEVYEINNSKRFKNRKSKSRSN